MQRWGCLRLAVRRWRGRGENSILNPTTTLKNLKPNNPQHGIMPNLLEIVRLFRDSVVLKPAEVSFHQGWKEAKAGDTRPVSELWDDIDAE